MLSFTRCILLTAFTANLAWANTFAQFCNDENCSEGCGISVDTTNPGCLTQIGRRSVKFHGDNFADVSMVASPGETCDCQNYCEEDIAPSILHPNSGTDCFVLRDEPVSEQCFLVVDRRYNRMLTIVCRLNLSVSSKADAHRISAR